ncbi:MAG: recombinase family protein [Micavibrio sp.]
MKRYALYARYSSDYQNPLSVQDQLFQCRRWVESQGGMVAGEYFDEAITGAFDNRPGFQKLIEDAKCGRFDVIVAEGLDRLSRDPADITMFFRNMTSREIPIYTLQEKFVDLMTVAFKGTMNAMFRTDLAIKVRRGQEACVRAGKFVGKAPYGYEYNREVMGNKLVNHGLMVVDAEAAVVRRIFQEYADGSSPIEIARRLNKDGIRRQKGKLWTDCCIRGNGSPCSGLLFNPIYVGIVQWGRQRVKWDYEAKRKTAVNNERENWTTVELKHLRVIDDALWVAVQSKKAEIPASSKSREWKNKGHILGSQRRPRYLMTGKLICGKCGGPMSISSNRIRCSSWAKGTGCLNKLSFDSRKIDQRVLSFFANNLLTDERLKQFLAACREEIELKTKEIFTKNNQVAGDIAKLKKQRDNILDRLAEGMKSKSLQDRLHEIEIKMSDLSRIQCEPVSMRMTDDQLIEKYNQAVNNIAQCLDRDQIKDAAFSLIRPLIEKVIMRPNGREYRSEIFCNLAVLTGCNVEGAKFVEMIG